MWAPPKAITPGVQPLRGEAGGRGTGDEDLPLKGAEEGSQAGQRQRAPPSQHLPSHTYGSIHTTSLTRPVKDPAVASCKEGLSLVRVNLD